MEAVLNKKFNNLSKINSIFDKYDITTVNLCWSYSRWKIKNSNDIDFFIDRQEWFTFSTYFWLKRELENILWKKVDLITKNNMKINIFNDIKKDFIQIK